MLSRTIPSSGVKPQLASSKAPLKRSLICTRAQRWPARDRVIDLLEQGYNSYNPGSELGPTVEELITTNPTTQPGFRSLDLGQGTWEVFYAPHIANMTSFLRTKFFPIRYHLEGTSIAANVKFEAPFIGTGWLSASGTMNMKDEASVEVNFDKFWFDLGDRLRTQLGDAEASDPLSQAIIQAGRLAFFPQLSVFPVLYLDEELCVFKFPPLNTVLGVRRVKALPPAPGSGSSNGNPILP